LNFKGFFLGNPWTDPKSNAIGRVQTLYGHGLVPKHTYDAWSQVCLTDVEPLKCSVESLRVLSESSYPTQNIDALTYPSCDSPSTFAQRLWFHRYHGSLLGIHSGEEDEDDVSELLAYDPCVDNYAVSYLNRDDVQAAIHVNTVNGTTAWTECSVKLEYNRTDGRVSMVDTYDYILHNPYGYPLKIEVYSGDDDSNCPTLGTMDWIWTLSTDTAVSWEPWYYNDTTYGNQFAGFYSQWDDGNLTFSTVHGAGHEVPTYKPEAALRLFQRYLAREV